MAVTFDAAGPSSAGFGQSSGTTPFSWTHTVGAGVTNGALLVGISIDGAPTSTTVSATFTPSGGSAVAMTSLGVQYSGGSDTAGYLRVFGLAASHVTPGAGTVTCTITGGGTTDVEGGSLSFSGVSQTAPFGTAATATGSGAATVATAGSTSGNLVAGFVAAGNAIGAVSSPATSQFVNNLEGGAGGFTGNAAGATSPGTGSAVTFTWAVSFFAAIAVEVLAAATSTPVALPDSGAGTDLLGVQSTTPALNDSGHGSDLLYYTAPASLSDSGAGADVLSTVRYIAGISANGYYFTDQTGAPRLFVGEDLWSLLANGGRYSGSYQSDFDTYFANRAAQGYTALEVSMWSTGDPNDNFLFTTGQDWDGTWPFGTGTSGSSVDPTTTPTAAFWAKRDYLLSSALKNGITVMFNAAGVGPSSPAANWTSAQWTAYGTFLGNRYKGQPNILWINGDGTFGNYDAGLVTWLTALRAAGDTHPVCYQGGDESTSRYAYDPTLHADYITFCVHAEFDWVYTYNPSYNGVIYAQQHEPSASDVVQGPIPVVWGDGDYLGAGVTAPQTDTHLEQNLIWWALSSGACGFSTGDNDIFVWGSTSAGFVTSKSFYSTTMPAITKLFAGLPGWNKLRADYNSALVTSGRGTPAATIAANGSPYTSNSDSYVTAAYAADGSLALIYCAQHFSITIDQTKMQSGYTATWADPATGALTPATAGSSYNSTALGNNSTGFADWLLILQGPVITPAALPESGAGSDSGPLSVGVGRLITARGWVS